jgi:purine-binding chemotaxis protein CheW
MRSTKGVHCDKEKDMSVEGITETRQYLSFKLDGEEFALDISKVREVLDFTKIRGSRRPRLHARRHQPKGLRGPVVDLNRKLGQRIRAHGQHQDHHRRGHDRQKASILGVWRTGHEVMELEPENIEPARA